LSVGPYSWDFAEIGFGEALAAEKEGDGSPWWAHVWPAGLALARHVVAGPRLDGQRCLDLGTGSGIVGIALAHMGAEVTFADLHTESLQLARVNAERNGVHGAAFLELDFRRPAGRTFDAVYASDVAYEADQTADLARSLAALVRPGGFAVLADAKRPPFKDLLGHLADAGLARKQLEEGPELDIARLVHTAGNQAEVPTPGEKR